MFFTPKGEKGPQIPANFPTQPLFSQHLPVDKTNSLCYILITKLEVLLLAKTLEYKGHPLQRKDNINLDVATKVSVQLQMTDPSIKSRDRVVKKSEKESLYAAMDVAAVWLERALSSR